MKKILLSLLFFIPTLVLAVNITVPQATNWGDILRGNANGTYTPVATSTLGISGGTVFSSGAVSTSSSETSTYIPFWTSTNGTPALLSGGTSNFTWNGSKLFANYASSTSLTSDLSAYFAVSGGRVGVGTTTPSTILSIQDSQPKINFYSNSLGLSSQMGMDGTATDCFDLITRSNYVFRYSCGAGSNALDLYTNNTQRLTIINNGNVGIGTTSPYSLLSVGGDLTVGASTAGGTLGDLYLPKLGTSAGAFLAVDGAGKVISTTTPSGSTYTATYPITLTGSAFGLAFGTTTDNTWSGLQTFTNTGTTTFSGSVSLGHPYFLTTHGLRGDASDGLYVTANNYTPVANFGVGNSANSVFNGGVNIDGTTRLATSLNGLLTSSSGTISNAVSGTDIKTINGSSILGSGNLTITGGSGLSTTTPISGSNLLVYSSSGAGSAYGVATTSVTCSGSVSCTSFNVLGSSPITITGTSSSFPFTVNSWGNSTTTTLGFLNGFLSTASSTATDIKVTGTFNVPSNTAPTLGSAGQIALDTTSNDLVFATSTSGSIIIQSATSTLFALNGTTTAITSGLVQKRPPFSRQTVVTDVGCAVTSGTSLQLYISDGTNNSNTITCTTTYTYYAFTTNNVFNANTNVQVVWGTKTGDTGDIISSFNGYQNKN